MKNRVRINESMITLAQKKAELIILTNGNKSLISQFIVFFNMNYL